VRVGFREVHYFKVGGVISGSTKTVPMLGKGKKELRDENLLWELEQKERELLLKEINDEWGPGNPINALEKSLERYRNAPKDRKTQGRDRFKEDLMEKEVYLGTRAGRKAVKTYEAWLRRKARDAVFERESMEYVEAHKELEYEYNQWQTVWSTDEEDEETSEEETVQKRKIGKRKRGKGGVVKKEKAAAVKKEKVAAAKK